MKTTKIKKNDNMVIERGAKRCFSGKSDESSTDKQMWDQERKEK